MNNFFEKLKKSLIIGVSAVIVLSSLSFDSPQSNSWFITGWLKVKPRTITVINDDNEEIEFRFGLLDFIKSWF